MTELVLSSGERAVLACPFLAYFRAEWELAQLLDLIESMGGPEVDNQFFRDIIFTFGNDSAVGPIIIEVGPVSLSYSIMGRLWKTLWIQLVKQTIV